MINFSKRIDALMHEIRNYSESSKNIHGEIVLWTTDGICYCLMPYVARFQKEYPDIKVKLVCTNEMPSFIHREADVSISYAPPRDFEPIKSKEYKLKFGLFASQKYINDYGVPKDLDDLIKNHRICDRKEYNNTWNEWRDIVQRARYVSSNCNTTAMLIKATKDGLGIGLHPLKYAKFEPEMKLLDIDLDMEHSCWVIYHMDDDNTPKIKLFIEEIDKCLKILSED